MADPSPIPNNGMPKGPESPKDPGEHAPLPDTLPAETQRALDSLYSRTPEAPAGYDQQVISAASQVMAAAGQARAASRQAHGRQHRRIRLPLAAGLAASLALVVGAWVLLSTTGGLGGPTFTGGTAETRAAKDGTMLIGKASPRETAGRPRGAGTGGAVRKEMTPTGAADAMSAADADGLGAARELSNKDAKLRYGEPAAPGQQPAPTAAAAMADTAGGQTQASPSSESPPSPAPIQTPALESVDGSKQQQPAVGSQPPGSNSPQQFSRDRTGNASPSEPQPAAAQTGGQAAPPGPPAAPAAGGPGGTTGAALPPAAKSAAPAVGEGAAKRGDNPAPKPGAGEKAKAEAPALDVVDAFRLAWIVNAEAAAAKRPDKDPPIGQPWMASARRDIDADGAVNQADVDALLRKLVKVPLVAPVADDASAAEVQFDVILDTGQTPLAGYQVEITGQGKAVRVVSVGAGTSVAFSEAPKYDGVSLGLARGYGDSRMAMNSDALDRNAVHLKSGVTPPELEGSKPLRLAAVSLKPAEELPHGQVTVARVGWRTADGAEPVMAIKLLAAVDATGERIKPTVKLERVKPILK